MALDTIVDAIVANSTEAETGLPSPSQRNALPDDGQFCLSTGSRNLRAAEYPTREGEMKKHEIKVGGLYEARISGRYVTVRVDAIREGVNTWASGPATGTRYDVTNLSTGRKTVFRSAAKFRGVSRSAAAAKSEVPAGRYDEETEQWVGGEQRADPTYRAAEGVSGPDASADDEEDEKCSDPLEPSDVETMLYPERVADRLRLEERAGRKIPTDTATIAVSPSTATASEESVAQTATTPALAAPMGSLAAQIAATMAPTRLPDGLTAQQRDILATADEIQRAMRGAGAVTELRQVDGQWVLVVAAGAGTGKTYTLKKLEEVLQGNGQYTAFNASLVAEAKTKFKRCAVNTTHSLAFRAVGKQFAHRLNGPRVRSYEIARRLGIKDWTVELPTEISKPVERDSPEWQDAALRAGYTDDNPPPADWRPRTLKTLKAAWLAGQVVTALRRFCMSADPEIGARHFNRIDGVDATGDSTNSDRCKAYLLPYAQRAWADLTDPSGTLMPYQHDYYVKQWQLSGPVIAADYILLDEAQDTAPVMLDILRQQKHALVILVGDDCQQIYEWRGAVNAMASFAGAPRRLLSQSFRFGQAVADVANSVLATLEAPTDLVMSGQASIPTRVCAVAEPRCYLYRTNAGAIARLMAAREAGKRGHLIGGSKEVVDFCRAAIDLQEKRGTEHPELGCFDTWEEVQEYSKTDEGQDMRLMVKLIDQFGAAEIRDALRDMPKEEDADLILSTAHRSKGREWASVKLGPDFATKDRLTDADRRLVYVAATRAQEELDLTECPTFCGDESRNAAGEVVFVPGIEVVYTAPMPTEEALAAYRAVRSAKPTPAPEPVPVAKPAAPTATYTKLRSGDWGVRSTVVVVAGQTVTVTTKAGQVKTETIKKVVWSGSGVWLAEVQR